MNKILMMVVMAVGLAAFGGSQNDTLVSTVVEQEPQALVWVKDGAVFSGFNADGTVADPEQNALVMLAQSNGRRRNVTFEVPAADVEGKYAGGTFQVCSLSAAAPSVELADLTFAYRDGTVVLNGEQLLLVGYPKAGQFSGFGWNGDLLAADCDCVAGRFAATNGKFDLSGLDGLTLDTDRYDYAYVVLDTRVPAVKGGERTLDGNFVTAWGEVRPGPDTTGVSVEWNSVKIGENAIGAQFDFDPTPLLTDGLAAVYGLGGPEDLTWYVFPTPPAYVQELDELPTLDGNDGYWAIRHPADMDAAFQLESAYLFGAFKDETEKEIVLAAIKGLRTVDIVRNFDPSAYYQDEPEKMAVLLGWYLRVVPFFEWNADFEVTFDGPIAQDSVILAGAYDYHSAWGSQIPAASGVGDWAGASVPRDLPHGEAFRLLKDNGSYDVAITYAEICTKVRDFQCGVYNHSSANWGKAITVKLNLYQTKRNDETGSIEETGRKYTVGTYKYTFKGPLNVNFHLSAEGNDPTGVELPASLSTNVDGRASFPLAVPAYDHEAAADLTFVGWSNQVENVTYVAIPSRTWATAENPIDLFAVWKAAKQTVITVVPDGEAQPEQKSVIKVTEEWLQEECKLDVKTATAAEIQAALEAPQGEAQRPAWQNYLLGMDPNADLKVEKTNGDEDDKALVVSTVEVSAPDAGIKVGYSLDKVDASEGVEKAGTEQDTKDLKIDLNPVDDTPTGYYKMNVIFTPMEENGQEGKKITIPSDNTIGVLKVESEETVVPVAVPWSALEDGGDIAVESIVKTSSLSEGDLMHVYDQEQNAYINLKLDDQGEWQPIEAYRLDETGGVTPVEMAAGAMKKVQRGSSVWLERKDPTKPFYLIGQYKKGVTARTQIVTKAKDAVKPEANLIAPPGIEDTDLNAVVNTGIGEKDQLMIVKSGVPTYFQWKDGKWSYPKQSFKVDAKGRARVETAWVDDEAVVPAGIGLWYLSDSGTPEIEWPEPAEVK